MQKTASSSNLKTIEQPVEFSKLHGAGNDFVVIDGRYGVPFEPEAFARLVCDRHFGVGADGLILLRPSRKADFAMDFFNPDGSRAICGNGMRCLARFIAKLGLLPNNSGPLQLETDKGNVQIELFGKGERARVDMGSPIFEGQGIPTAETGEHIEFELHVGGSSYICTAVGMGNPHCVIFCDEIDSLPLEKIGPGLEHHPFFPKRTNVEFVQVVNEGSVRMRVWERGAGETLACGTGVCAVAAASARTGRTSRELQVETRGGRFEVAWNESNGRIFLTGPAEEVFSGKLLPSMLQRAASIAENQSCLT